MTSTQPFRIAITDGELADLRERLHATRWPDAGHSGATIWAWRFPLSNPVDIDGALPTSIS